MDLCIERRSITSIRMQGALFSWNIDV